MIGRSVRVFPPRVLIVDDGLARLDTSLGRATGFEHVTEGAEVHDGTYHVLCVR